MTTWTQRHIFSFPLSLPIPLPLLLILLTHLRTPAHALTYIGDADPRLVYNGPYAKYNANVPLADLTDLEKCYNQTYTGIAPGASVVIPFNGTGISIYGIEDSWQASFGRNTSISISPSNPSATTAPSPQFNTTYIILPPSHNPTHLLNTSVFALNALPSASAPYTLTMAVNAYGGNVGSTASFYFDYVEVAGEEDGMILETSAYVVVGGASTRTSMGVSTSVGIGTSKTAVGGVPTGSVGSTEKASSMPEGKIVAITLGALAAILLLLFSLLFLWHRHRLQQQRRRLPNTIKTQTQTGAQAQARMLYTRGPIKIKNSGWQSAALRNEYPLSHPVREAESQSLLSSSSSFYVGDDNYPRSSTTTSAS